LVAATATVAQSNEEIRIGSPLALTGAYAFFGVSVRRGMEIGIDEINAQGGINGSKIKWIVEDDAGDRAQTVNLATRMIARDNVVAIMGPSTTIESLAIAPLVNERQVVMLGNSPSPDVRKAGKWSFNLQEPPSSNLGRLAQYGIDALKIKRVAMVFPRENEGYIVQKNLVREHWKANGVEIVSENAISAKDADFAALGTKLANEKLDAVSIYLPPEQAGNLVVQARRAGLAPSVRIVAPSSLVTQVYLDAGGKAAEGSVMLADFIPDSSKGSVKAFVAAYSKKFGHLPDNWAAIGYTAAHALSVAITKGGNDRAKVRDALEQLTNMPSVLGGGTYSIGPDRVPQYGGTIVVVKNGRFVHVVER
jgi:branched-chain amino acid transport system substrate-binding protein